MTAFVRCIFGGHDYFPHYWFRECTRCGHRVKRDRTEVAA